MAVVPRRTKIVATIGPASSEPEVLLPLMRVIDGARLNFSHGTHEDHARARECDPRRRRRRRARRWH